MKCIQIYWKLFTLIKSSIRKTMRWCMLCMNVYNKYRKTYMCICLSTLQYTWNTLLERTVTRHWVANFFGVAYGVSVQMLFTHQNFRLVAYDRNITAQLSFNTIIYTPSFARCMLCVMVLNSINIFNQQKQLGYQLAMFKNTG